MIVDRVEHPGWLSNAYLIADEPGGHGVLVDSNGLTAALEERAAGEEITITHVLCTHGHGDHIVDIADVAKRVGAPLLAHPLTDVAADARIADGETIGVASSSFARCTRRGTASTTSRSSRVGRTA